MPWFESIKADAVFGWRQLKKHRLGSSAAILSLGLAIGACSSAFRIIDALLLRPLPVSDPERLYVLGREGIDPGGHFRISDSFEYPLFRGLRTVVKDEAELIAVSYADRGEVTYGSEDEMEKIYRQYVSGWMFGALGLRPALGRLFAERDDVSPGAHPYAVLSHDYWTRRFGQDRNIVGRTFRMANDVYEIVGVAPERFSGTETGIGVDIFLPTMMQPWVNRSDASWFRIIVQLKSGVTAERVVERLRAPVRSFDENRAKAWTAQSKQFIERFLKQKVVLEPAPSGRSDVQKNFRVSLWALGVLVALVLVIACVNIANLMMVQAAARAREMALRVSIGAGRSRLVQMVLVESGTLALLAAVLGTAFASWSAPLVVRMSGPAQNPVRLYLAEDWRVLAFGIVVTACVTLLLGLPPALRASAVTPAIALRGGADPHARSRLMHGLIAAQIAFCFVVVFAAGLFVNTFERLSKQPTGFSSERLLTLDTVARRAQPAVVWSQVAEHLRATPGVESVSLAGWALLDGNGWNGIIWVNGAPTEVLAYFLAVSPGWTETMKIPFVAGRDLRASDTYPGLALVNEAFAKQCFKGENPVGKWFDKETGDGVTRTRFLVAGVVKNARYRNMREPITPTAYVPFNAIGSTGESQPVSRGTFLVRTSGQNPLASAETLRREVSRARPELRVSNIRTQTELIQQHTVRERLLATLALFFAVVALLLAGVGLYGVIDYSVLQRRREIGIRIALGAPSREVAWRVSADVFFMVLVGAIAGLTLGFAAARYAGTLLYDVKTIETRMVALASISIFAVALLAALRPATRAVRIDPAEMLRSE
jgi:putative ABC transport system permease protein